MSGWRPVRERGPFDEPDIFVDLLAVAKRQDRETLDEVKRLGVVARHGEQLADVISLAAAPLDLDNVGEAAERPDEPEVEQLVALVASAPRPRGRRVRCDVATRRATLVASGAPVPWPVIEAGLRRRGWLA